ncbi:MAG: patatin-like phospholipase family protein [Desulfarculaceae bacterium]|nr:patatin-like phospholipase family protein [Desulfarculaceae bacterium]MCF8071781.1 patatin-like phospholipase family protein [Desulfarculaceae bacterium]MCF8101331.1 patatin-like phospholipase family protein [Desulfarculaceae bacterium]MCF8117290.1 patatin-like phospholipase family protein [Desulfarculaceae bacterium]
MSHQAQPMDPSALPHPVAAVMSSGFFGFFAHAGFLQGLAEAGLKPDCYAGSSSGALVAAFAAGGMDPAFMLSLFRQLKKGDFWDPPSFAHTLRWLLGGLRGRSGYVAGEAFERLLRDYLPAKRFEDCARPCLMSALDLATSRRVVLDSGDLPRAVRASGAVPALFAAVEMNGGLLVDGGIIDKAPLIAAVERLGAASLVVHLLPSGSLERPVSATLARSFAPLRLQSRAVDGARLQFYEDQKRVLAERGVTVIEVVGQDLPRCGPKRMHQGPAAFEAARQNTLAQLRAAQPGQGA